MPKRSIMEGWGAVLGCELGEHITFMGARVLYRKGLWAPEAVSGTEDLEGRDNLGQRLK